MKRKKAQTEKEREKHRSCEAESREGIFSLKGRVWIEGPEETFLGYGRIVLLERIREHGSISAAARSMGMSYRQAWKLVDSMNRQAGKPLVQTFIGGKKGGGAKLTQAGEKAISAFWTFYKDFQEFLEREGEKILPKLLEETNSLLEVK
jgi:molybdate transport system regulatory protein